MPENCKKFENEVDELLEEWQRLEKSAENHTAFIHELRETNNSLLSTKQNETMKTLTVLAFLFLPLTFIGQLFGMSLPVPLSGVQNSFWIVLGGMGLLAFCFFLYFKRKDWL